MTVFHEQWCSDNIQSAITASLDEVKDLEGYVVEIGAWEGQSTVHIANCIYPDKIITIDPHDPFSVEENWFRDHGEQRTTYLTFLNNIKNGTKGNIIHFRMGWFEFFKTWKDPIKFIYVDGPHEYNDVVEQLKTILPFIVEDGIILGDDYYDIAVQNAFRDVLPETIKHPLSKSTALYRKKKP